MGYDLHITRRAEWHDHDSGPEITQAEWLAYIKSSPNFKLAGQNGPCLADWTKSGLPEGHGPWIDWSDGELYSKNPPPELILEMIRIAAHFNAKVQGDDGEDYNGPADIKRYR